MRYKGSLKHKDWRPGGGFGTLCPPWTHEARERGFGGDPEEHCWPVTTAQRLLDDSVEGGDGRRYTTGRGIAFVALATNDGTWHGFPLPWEDVPSDVRTQFIESERVLKRDIGRQSIDGRDRRWALGEDE